MRSGKTTKAFCVMSLLLLVALSGGRTNLSAAETGNNDTGRESALLDLLHQDPVVQFEALERLGKEWDDSLTPALLEFISLGRNPVLQQYILEMLRKHTGGDFGYDLNAWFDWAWKQDLSLPPDYAEFKSRLYERIDPRFATYFSPLRASDIRLDEIRWGGVVQDGIPPLRKPTMIPAAKADYLDDENIVFGLEVNGDLRAYPKRILAWHEMFVDTVGGVPVTGVYCTLCGSMILYESNTGGVQYEMGTSGFLFRSNKLMYDRKTQSLWNTMWGTPVVGPLVGRGIRLPRRSVVTTTWGEWRRRHPETTVLSLSTGYSRDYGEGVAYYNYFATDELMFNSSKVDQRLPNKADVLGLVFPDSGHPPLAIAADYARKHPLLHERIGDREFIVITDKSGAMRVYESGGVQFESWDQESEIHDATGRVWTVHEDRLTRADGKTVARLPSHNAFWFGWFGAYTNTRLLY